MNALLPAVLCILYSIAAGTAAGAFLAAVTHTTRPGLIWLCLVCFAASILAYAWFVPIPSPATLQLPPHAPLLLYNYYQIIRPLEFVLSMLWIFAMLGRHSSDQQT